MQKKAITAPLPGILQAPMWEKSYFQQFQKLFLKKASPWQIFKWFFASKMQIS